jgi:hypothetical protein
VERIPRPRPDGNSRTGAPERPTPTPEQASPKPATTPLSSHRAAQPGTTVGGAIVQTKLAVGAANDPYEREADAVAARVVRSLRSQATSPEQAATQADPQADPGDTAGRINRVQRRAVVGAQGGDLDEDTTQMLRASLSGGAPLPEPARSKMEGAFGADFSGIRVHAGPRSTELNNRIQAKAFTTGNDIFFRDGVPDATTGNGQELLAHELTHTIQQGAADPINRSTERLGGRTSPAQPSAEPRGAPAEGKVRRATSTALSASPATRDVTIQRWHPDSEPDDYGYEEAEELLSDVEWDTLVPTNARDRLKQVLSDVIGATLSDQAKTDFEVAIAKIAGDGASPQEELVDAFALSIAALSLDQAETLRDDIDAAIRTVGSTVDSELAAAAAKAKSEADLLKLKLRLTDDAYNGWMKSDLEGTDFNSVMTLGAEHDDYLKALGKTHHAALKAAVGLIGSKAVALWVTGCAGKVDAAKAEKCIGIAARLPSKKETQIGTFFGAVGGSLEAVMNTAKLFFDAGNMGQHTTEQPGGGGSARSVATAHGWTVAEGDIAHYLAGHSYSDYVMTDVNASRGTSTMWPLASKTAQITTDARGVVAHATFQGIAGTVSEGYQNKSVSGFRTGLDKGRNRVTQMYPLNGTQYSPDLMRSIVRLMKTKG